MNWLMKWLKSEPRSTFNEPTALEYDKSVDLYFTNLINAIVLFSYKRDELHKLAGPGFDPMFEFETELDEAYAPVCLETIFRNNLIEKSLKNDLLSFKHEIDNMPSEIWDWDLIDEHDTWKGIRLKANNLLDKLQIQNRIYNDNYITVYGIDGKVLKKERLALRK